MYREWIHCEGKRQEWRVERLPNGCARLYQVLVPCREEIGTRLVSHDGHGVLAEKRRICHRCGSGESVNEELPSIYWLAVANLERKRIVTRANGMVVPREER